MSIDNILSFLKEYNYVASYVSLILSFTILWMSDNIQKELENFKNKLIFKKRLPKILIKMDKNLKDLNSLINKGFDYKTMRNHLNQYVDILRGLIENNDISSDLKYRIKMTKDTIERKLTENNIETQVYNIKHALTDIYNNLDRLKSENEEL